MKKILLIEDDRALLENITAFLQEEGFKLKFDVTGSSTVELTKSWGPDLIICDISLPGLSGYEIREILLQDEKLKRIPFIYLTAKVEREDLRKGMKLGADDYIFKPFDLEDLLISINLRLEKVSRLNPEESNENQEIQKIYSIEDKILIKSGTKIEFCFIKDIKFITSKNPYIEITFVNGKNTLIRQTLNEWEEKLPANYFIRIHRSVIINTNYIKKITKASPTSYLVNIKDEPKVFTISKRYSAKLKEFLV